MSGRLLYNLLALLWVAIMVSGCSGWPARQRDSMETTLPQSTSELQEWASRQARRYPGRSGMLLLGSGTDALDARLSLIDRARRSIDVQYYLIRDDNSGRLFLSHLLDAAQDTGVGIMADVRQ